MQKVLDWIGRGFNQGTLEFATADGRRWSIGSGGPQLRVGVRDAGVLRRILLNPQLHFGETYVDGLWEPDGCDLRAVLGLAVRLGGSLDRRMSLPLRRLRARWEELNTPLASRRNAAHHYDVDYEVYRRFLDADLHYSCAYFAEDGMSLEQAQQAKCALIARKLDLRPGACVLDIGCGWGSLAMFLAEHYGAHVTGITLSQPQLEVAQRRAHERGLAGRVEFRLQDYRLTEGEFDAIVSVGMFEHVGRPQYQRFFDQVAARLKLDGTALLHTIGRVSPPTAGNPWIRKYIFPGGYIPAASELLVPIEYCKLVLSDLEVWRYHYARTLAHWRQRFQACRAQLPPAFDERFQRMWSFYLAASEASFVDGDLVVFHAQLARRLDRLPLTRDYLYRDVAVPDEMRYGPTPMKKAGSGRR